MNTLYIPSDLKVGFQKREDTFTKKLAYIIYVDHTGKVRKETSWQQWRDKKLDPVDLKNEPTEGFVLNKKVGGYKCSWNYRDAHVRVYDPRDFEFEISVPNLLFILSHCDCSRGKGLEGKFVYAWAGTELVLLPVCAEEFKTSQNFTNLQAKSVKGKELIPGAAYITKDQQILSYLGRFDCYSERSSWDKENKVCKKKEYVFWNDAKQFGGFVFHHDLKKIASLHSEEIRSDFADLVQKYYRSTHGSKAVRLFTKPFKNKQEGYWVGGESDGVFQLWSTEYKYPRNVENPQIEATSPYQDVQVKDGILTFGGRYYSHESRTYPPEEVERMKKEWQENRFRYGHTYERSFKPYVAPTNLKLWCLYESGAEHPVR